MVYPRKELLSVLFEMFCSVRGATVSSANGGRKQLSDAQWGSCVACVVWVDCSGLN